MKKLFVILFFVFLVGCTKQMPLNNQSPLNNVSPYNATGTISDTLWFLTRGGPNTDKAWAVAAESARVYVADYETVPGPWSDIYLYAFSDNGTELWKKQWKSQWNDQAYAIMLDEQIFVGGAMFKGMLQPTADSLIIAFDKQGNELWNFTWDQGYGYEEVDGLVVYNNEIYASGWTTSEHSQDIFVMKLDKKGNLVWSKVWGSEGWDEANGQMVVENNTIFVSGRYNATTAFTGGQSLLVAFDKDGNYKWHTLWSRETADALGMVSDKNFLYVTGLAVSPSLGGQIILLKYDKNGNLQWEREWGGSGAEASRMVLTDDELIYVVGKTNSYGNGKNDILLLVYDKEGTLQWFKTWGGAGLDETHGASLFENNLYIAGETDSYGAGKQDALILKAYTNGNMPSSE